MAKLWSKGYDLDAAVERFTVGDDYILDRSLAAYDVLGSLAHARMLKSIGILTKKEHDSLAQELKKLLKLARAGRLEISPRQEDVHTAVEEKLTARLGDAGKKLHTGRSRNDQVLTDIRMYARDRLLQARRATLSCAERLRTFAKKNEFAPMPGRTHTQRAMPSSVGTWAGAFAEALLDDHALLACIYRLINQCPLGSAAGYGSSLKLDRDMTSRLLAFEKPLNNVLYAQNSRGKFEAMAVFALSQVNDDLARLANDTILFSVPEFGYFTLPDAYCPGSSIMPQKKNPGPLELVRARASVTASLASRLGAIVRNLPSGYNRDLQETKRPLMEAFDTVIPCLEMTERIFKTIKVNRAALTKSFSPELFAADEATRLASQGVPFREAYRQVAAKLKTLKNADPRKNIRAKTHKGAPGNLALQALAKQIAKEQRQARKESARIEKAFAALTR